MNSSTDTVAAPRARLAIVVGAAVSVVAAACVAWWFTRSGARENTGAGRLASLVALGGEARAPALSPDGARLAFAWNGAPGDAGGFQLYVLTIATGERLRLTNVPARWIHPAWSPDGQSIAFTRQIGAPGGSGSGVFVVPAVRGAERRVAGASFADPVFMQISWSADGRRIAYSTYTENGSHALRIVDQQTLLIEPLAPAPDCWNAGMPAFSPDGARLAFACATAAGVYGVHVIAPGGRPTRLATIMGELQGLTWDADGSHLVVANDAGDGGALWRLSLDGALTRLPYGDAGSAPTRADRDVAYVHTRSSIEVWRMDLTAREPAKTAQRILSSSHAETAPRFSPDAAHIAFRSNRTGRAEIWIADADGTNQVRLTQFSGPLVGAPAWCSDGERLAFDVRAAGSASIYLLDVAERRPTLLASANSQNAWPAWSAGCDSILASDAGRGLYKLPIGGGPAELFTKQQSFFAQIAGDTAIFATRQPGGIALWSKPLAGGLEGALPGMPLLDYTQAWAAAPGAVFYTAQGDGGAELLRYDITKRAVRRIAALAQAPPTAAGPALAVSADGRWVLYTQPGETGSEILRMDNP